MDDLFFRRLIKVFLCVVGLVVFGTTGYVLIEGWSLLDGFYMTVITLSTVGYGEIQTLTPPGRYFTAVLIFFCLVSMTCWTAALTSFIVESDLQGSFLRRRTLKMVAQLKKHTIVCGSGLMAQAVIERLIRARQSVVVVSDNPEEINQLRKRFRRLLIVEGKATDELTLAEANVLEAKNVVAAMESEIDNLLIAITCKDMGRDIAVFARSNDSTIANRMRKAGVDEVISPCQLCGDRVAQLILTPDETRGDAGKFGEWAKQGALRPAVAGTGELPTCCAGTKAFPEDDSVAAASAKVTSTR